MNNNRLVIICLVLASLLGLWYFATQMESRYKWYRTYRLEENEPYDLSLFYRTLKAEYGDQFDEIQDNESLEETYNRLSPGNADIYMYVGRNCYLTPQEVTKLKSHIYEGGTAFVSANGLPEALLNDFPVLQKTFLKSEYLDSFPVQFRHPQAKPSAYTFFHYKRMKNEPETWNVFSSGRKNDTLFEASEEDFGAVALVSAHPNLGPDMICVYHGSGRLFLHANPAMFGNVYQTRKYGRNYLATILKHLPGKRLVFDRGAGFPKKDAFSKSSGGNLLSFIKSQPPLWYAWQVLLVSVMLFLVFAGRRKQRSIPVIEAPVNHTMAFVDAVGRFYKNEKQNALVFHREWSQFLVFVRQQFRIRLQTLSEEELQRLADRSGVSLRTISRLMATHEKYRIFSELSNQELTETNEAIGQFYQEYRKNYGKSGNTKRTTKPA